MIFVLSKNSYLSLVGKLEDIVISVLCKYIKGYFKLLYLETLAELHRSPN